MTLKKITLLFVLLFSIKTVKAQSTLDQYKYAIIPLQYEFLKEKDAYRLNTLTRHLFKQQGFTVYFDTQQFPEDLNKNRCLAMYTEVIKVKNGFLSTKLQIVIKDCRNNEVFISEVGTSKEKQYKEAYQEALRIAFKSIENLNYKYNPSPNTIVSTPPNNIETKENTQIPKPPKVVEPPKTTQEETVNRLTAKPISNGFQLLDSNAAVVITLLKTASSHIFIVEGKKAIVYKENSQWIYSENKGYSISREELQIKF